MFRGAVSAQVSTALTAVKRVLDNTRNPQYPADVAHAYDDKYLLAEFAVKAGVLCHVNALEAVTGSGWNAKLDKMLGWAATRSVTLRFFAEEKCAFDRTEHRKVDSATERVTTSTVFAM